MMASQRATVVALLILVVMAGFLGYWGYSSSQRLNPAMWLDVVSGTAQAPVQYRIGVILPASMILRHSHLAFRHVFTAIDITSSLVAVLVLFYLLRQTAAYREANEQARWFASAGFVGLVQFYFGWLVWYQRPETQLTTAALALSLLLLTVHPPFTGWAGALLTQLALIFLAFAQGFVRADVMFALHLGVLLCCLASARIGNGFALPRWSQAGTSLLAMVGVCIQQYYLMHFVYPLARYEDAKMIQLLINLKNPSQWVPFLLFLSPVIWTLVTVKRHTDWVEAPAAGFLAGSLIFLMMWLTLGRIEEVRIFLPFALGLVPLTISLAIRRCIPGKTLGTA